MKTLRIHGCISLFGVFALAACDDSGTEPLLDDLTLQEQMELEVLTDPGSFDIAIELTEATNDVAFSHGNFQAPTGRGL